jgi:hypothetical protein
MNSEYEPFPIIPAFHIFSDTSTVSRSMIWNATPRADLRILHDHCSSSLLNDRVRWFLRFAILRFSKDLLFLPNL